MRLLESTAKGQQGNRCRVLRDGDINMSLSPALFFCTLHWFTSSTQELRKITMLLDNPYLLEAGGTDTSLDTWP